MGEKEESLRTEVRALLSQFLSGRPPVWANMPGAESDVDLADRINHALAERGWIVPAWPVEYGGMGASIYEQMVFAEEYAYAAVPDNGIRGFGGGLVGPTIIVHGNDEQKREYLPKITSGEHRWCQGFSEPGAGSDLASLSTRAVRDGDEWVINGQKIWTSGGMHANQMFLLARTDPDVPKHKGISFLIIDDMESHPGLTVRPLVNMADRTHFAEVFFEDVRIPARNVIGGEGRGWYVAMTLLEFERSGIGGSASQRRILEDMAGWLRDQDAHARSAKRIKLADLAVANQVGQALAYRIGHMQTAGLPVSYEASVTKLYNSTLAQQITGFGVNMLGLNGLRTPWVPASPLEGMAEAYEMTSPMTVYGGSSEIQKGIIATRGLGLPR